MTQAMAKKNKKPENKSFKTLEIEVEKEHEGMNPKQFMLWGFLGTVTILFTGIMAAYIIKRSSLYWFQFPLPWQFYLSTLSILLSSVSMHFAVRSAKEDDISKLKLYLWLTLGLGLTFTALQVFSWNYLMESRIGFARSSSSAFLYIMSGFHALHVLGGLVYLIVLISKAANFEVHSRALPALKSGRLYWHFVDALWLYVFIFLLIFR